MKEATEQQIQFALNNIEGAIKYILDAEKKHPNRIDVVRDSMSEGVNQNVFAQKAVLSSFRTPMPTINTIDTPSQSAFGQPTFGTPSQPFAPGSKPNPFAPSRAIINQPSFGAPSQPGRGGAFGQPSALGQKLSPFYSAPSGDAFVSFANAGSAFGEHSKPGPNVFAAPSQPATVNIFTSSPIPFGAPPPVPKNPFANPSTNSNPFTSNLGNLDATKSNSPFPSTAALASNPFRAEPSATNPTNVNPFGKPAHDASPSYQPAISGETTHHPPLNSYATAGPNGRLETFKGRRVVYKDGQPGFEGRNRTWQKIWFPTGPPTINKDTEMEDGAYDDETKRAYVNLQQTGIFQNDVMPMVPPKQEWCLWDF